MTACCSRKMPQTFGQCTVLLRNNRLYRIFTTNIPFQRLWLCEMGVGKECLFLKALKQKEMGKDGEEEEEEVERERACVCVCVCVRARARARMRACVFVCVCARERIRACV